MQQLLSRNRPHSHFVRQGLEALFKSFLLFIPRTGVGGQLRERSRPAEGAEVGKGEGYGRYVPNTGL